jgi:hypothetical protein
LNQKSLDNLKPWKPGQSGNPAGKPKRPSFEALVNAALDKEMPGHGITKREVIAQTFVDKLIEDQCRDAFAHFIKRAWPEVNKHEVSADIEANISAEMDLAAAELRRMLEERS